MTFLSRIHSDEHKEEKISFKPRNENREGLLFLAAFVEPVNVIIEKDIVMLKMCCWDLNHVLAFESKKCCRAQAIYFLINLIERLSFL